MAQTSLTVKRTATPSTVMRCAGLPRYELHAHHLCAGCCWDLIPLILRAHTMPLDAWCLDRRCCTADPWMLQAHDFACA